MATQSWDSFAPSEFESSKDQKNGDNKRRHDDIPRYNANEGTRKPRTHPFHNRNNHGRIPDSKHDNRQDNGNRSHGMRGGDQFNNRNITNSHNNANNNSHNNVNANNAANGNNNSHMRNGKPRTTSGNFDDQHPKPSVGKGPRQFRNGQREHTIDNRIRHPQQQGGFKSEAELEDLRTQVTRMKSYIRYLKTQVSYKDQVLKHKENVVTALRGKLEKLKVGSSEHAEPSTSPIEPHKSDEIKKIEDEMAKDDPIIDDKEQTDSGDDVQKENEDKQPKEEEVKTEEPTVEEAEVKPAEETEVKPADETEVKPVEETEVKPVDETEVKPADEAEVKPVEETETKQVEETEEKTVEEAKVEVEKSSEAVEETTKTEEEVAEAKTEETKTEETDSSEKTENI